MRRLVPVHLLLGMLGSGKTTTLIELLRQMPAGERWGVFVNEFGSVGLDKAIIGNSEGTDRDGIAIHEAPGGCICCSAQADLEEGIDILLRKFRPDRIFIEPTGLADIESLVRQIRQKGNQWGIDLYSVIGHIDIRMLRNPEILKLPFWNKLVQLSDDIIGTKPDKAGHSVVETFEEVMESLLHSLRSVHVGRKSFLEMDWRAASHGQEPVYGETADRQSIFPASEHDHEGVQVQETKILEGRGVCIESVGRIHYTVGWLFEEGLQFSYNRIDDWIRECRKRPFPPIRLKGILHTDQGWTQLQMVNGDFPEFTLAQPRADSRMELVANVDSGSWRDFEKLLL